MILPISTRLSVVLVILAAFCSCGIATAQDPGMATQSSVNLVQLPEGALVPSAAVDAAGVIHLVYGMNKGAYYVCSADNGRTLSKPIKINSTGSVETKMGERGPKLALGKGGVIHVVWMDEWAPGVKTFARYARSIDGGKSFSETKSLSSMSGVDGVTVVSDTANHVISFWHVMQGPKPAERSATWIYMARSLDNGATFKADERVNIDNHKGLACSMCMMSGQARADGRFNVAFRSAQDNLRDTFVLIGDPEKNSYSSKRVNYDNWKYDRCPMNGPELKIDPSGRLLCAYMSNHRVYWSFSERSGVDFSLHVAAPQSNAETIYSTAIANRKGQVLFLWQEGPMAVDQKATVKWACYNLKGTPTGQKGTVGVSNSGTKATAVVGADDQFYVFTTAK